MLRVGTNSLGYNQVKNFAGLPFEDVTFSKVLDVYKFPAHFYFKASGKVIPKYINRFNDFGLNNVDLYHFFNSITPVRKPWIVTYELSLPRQDPNFANGYKWLASPYCKRIIAFTKRAYDAQKFYLSTFSDLANEIQSKICVMYPSQQLHVDNANQKNFEGQIVFTIVGRSFFRKGGFEVLAAFERLVEEGLPVKLNVVSNLETDGYKDKHVNAQMLLDAKRRLLNNPAINFYESMSNKQVIDLYKSTHIGLLPSYGETFGYSLLEAMSCGCAVIVTNISPFNEFIDTSCGWLIDVPVKIDHGIQVTDTYGPGKQVLFSAELEKGLYSTILQIVADRQIIYTKAQNAIDRVRMHFDPADRVRQLSAIYQSALT